MALLERIKKKGVKSPMRRLSVSAEGEIFLENHSIYIKLSVDRFRRKIADLAKYNGSLVLLMRRDRDKHMQRDTRSYGFNEFTLRFAKKATHVYLIDDRGNYLIPIEEIKEQGRYLHFKQAGLERQLFFPIYSIERHRIA